MKTVPCSARAHQIRLAGAALLFLTALAAASCSDSSTNQDATPDAAVEGDTGTDTRQDTGVDDAQNVGADTEDETARDADSDAQLEADAQADTQADADTEPDAQVDPNADFHTCYPNAFCTPEGEPITMNGLNIRDVDRYAGSTTLEQMQKIKAKGFNLVRLAMYWTASSRIRAKMASTARRLGAWKPPSITRARPGSMSSSTRSTAPAKASIAPAPTCPTGPISRMIQATAWVKLAPSRPTRATICKRSPHATPTSSPSSPSTWPMRSRR